MKSGDLENQYRRFRKILKTYTLDGEKVFKKEEEMKDDALIVEIRFAFLWANASTVEEKKPLNARSFQTYQYFMKKVEEQFFQNGDWDIPGLKLGTSLLIPKSLYPRQVLNELFYFEENIPIVDAYLRQYFGIKPSLASAWKKRRKNVRLNGLAKNFGFADLKSYYELYRVEDGVYKQIENGKEIIDETKKIRVAFSHLWHKAAKTRNLAADKDYYIYCADAADTYDAINERINDSITEDGIFDLKHFIEHFQDVIEKYADAETIIKRLFQTEMDAQITYDFFSTLNLDMKDVKTLFPTMRSLEAK